MTSGLGGVLAAAMWASLGYWAGADSGVLETIGFGACVGVGALLADFAIWCVRNGRKVLRRP